MESEAKIHNMKENKTTFINVDQYIQSQNSEIHKLVKIKHPARSMTFTAIEIK